MDGSGIELARTKTGISVAFSGAPQITDLGVGLHLNHRWLWSFDGSLSLATAGDESGTSGDWGSDQLGRYFATTLIYADAAGPLVQLQLKNY